jgi:hypothetical protein
MLLAALSINFFNPFVEGEKKQLVAFRADSGNRQKRMVLYTINDRLNPHVRF